VAPAEFASTVEPGMALEMSIVLRQKDSFQDNGKTCPRCGHISVSVKPYNGWIEWQVSLEFRNMWTVFDINVMCCSHSCSGYFQVAKASENSEDKADERHGEGMDTSYSRERHNGYNEEGEGANEEIVSPASYVQ
jgi:hypothetical protein